MPQITTSRRPEPLVPASEGRRLRAARESLGIELRTLTRQAGVRPAAAVQAFEHGEQPIRLMDYYHLVTALKSLTIPPGMGRMVQAMRTGAGITTAALAERANMPASRLSAFQDELVPLSESDYERLQTALVSLLPTGREDTDATAGAA